MSLARIAALPCWQGTPVAQPLAGGLSNDNWKVTDAAGSHVVRFGADYPFHHVSRAREVAVSRAAQAAGFGPQVRYAGPGVMVTGFITSTTWSAADVRADPGRVADLLARFHRDMPAQIGGQAVLFWVFHVIRDYARTLRGSRWQTGLDEALRVAQALEAVQVPLPIIFGHNDLLPANLLEDGARLWLIDYEYAGFSTALFDLAGLASNSDMTQAQAHVLLRAYFGADPDEPLLRAFGAMQCASLLREAMWAMVSQMHLSAPGVDYAAYAAENMEKFGAALRAYTLTYGKL